MQIKPDKTENTIFESFEGAISKYRLKPYHSLTLAPQESIARYLWNVSLSESLYPAIGFFEIAFRNSLHNALSASRGRWRQQNDTTPFLDETDPRWFVDGRVMEERELKEVHVAMERLHRNGKRVYPLVAGEAPLEPQRVIAELSLGFFVNLYSDKYTVSIVGPTAKSVFPRAPKPMRLQGNIAPRLQEILSLRNRISHHEPIHNDPQLREKHDRLLEMLGWIEPQQLKFLQVIDRFEGVYRGGEGWKDLLYPVEFAIAELHENQLAT